MKNLREWALSLGIILGAILGSGGWYLFLVLAPVEVQAGEVTRPLWSSYDLHFTAPGIYFGALWGGFVGWLFKRGKRTLPGR